MSIQFPKEFPTMPLNTQLILREHSDADVQSFFDYYTPTVNAYIIAPKPGSVNEAKAEIQYCKNLFHFKRGIYWTIAIASTGQMIGAIGLTTNAMNRRAELHYDLDETHWGKGIMSQAIEAVIAFAFKEMGLIRIEAITMDANTASHKVLTKNGFAHEGRLHAYKFYDGKPMDVEMFAITASQHESGHGHS